MNSMPDLNPVLEGLFILVLGVALLVFRNLGAELTKDMKKEVLGTEHQKFMVFIKWAAVILGAGLTLDGIYLLTHVLKS
jgi:hypothetical protein